MIKEVKEALTSLETEGSLTPQAVVESARSEKSPLHNFFDWDDESAGGKYRLEQARSLIQSYTVEFIGPDQISKVVRGYVSVQTKDAGRVYKRVEVVLSNNELRDQMLENLRSEIRNLQAKYGHLLDFHKVLEEEIKK